MNRPLENLKQLGYDPDKDRKELLIDRDMLEGNINRMMVTHDHDELLRMFANAHMRLDDIYRKNSKRINILNAKNDFNN